MQLTKVIRVFETFAGIGAQHKAISNLKSNTFRIVGTSEWDARAIIAYAQIHHKNKFDSKLIEVSKWSEKEINDYLYERTFSLNSKTPGKPTSKPLHFKQNLVAANIVNNNYPDITKIMASQVNDIDLLTYSFPCQGLSIANMGRDLGIDQKTNSTSNLLWQIKRLLLDLKKNHYVLPKYLLMENVRNLLSKKHKKDYDKWLAFLNSLGYKTNTLKINGLNHGSIQKRVRVFAISTFNPKDYTDDAIFEAKFRSLFGNQIGINDREILYKKILNSSNAFKEEIKNATPNKTRSRERMAVQNIDLLKRERWKQGEEWTFNTLTTKQDRHPNIGMIGVEEIVGKLNKRFVTPREAYQIMGFESSDYDRVHKKYVEGIMTKESLYRQAGNSIIVSVLEDIFKFIQNLEKGVHNE